MRAIIVCMQIAAIMAAFHGGNLVAWGYRGWGWALLALGAGWSGIISASLFTMIRNAKELP